MSNPILEMVKTPKKPDDIEDMSTSLHEKDNSIIAIKNDGTLKEHAEGLAEQVQGFFNPDTLLQLAIALGLMSLSYTVSVMWRKRLKRLTEKSDDAPATFSKAGRVWLLRLGRVLFPAILALMLLITSHTATWLGWPNDLLRIIMNLSVAGFIVRFISTFLHSRVIAKWVSSIIWIIATLHILGLSEMTIELLDSISFGMSDNKISLLSLIKGGFYFILFMWVAKITAGAAERKIKKLEELTPSLRVLFSKLLRITLIVTAFMLGLNAIGVDLTSFAIFGGAIGVGLGFGLQKVVSNFISGIILLLDRSIKPGDVIAVEGSFGWVNTLGARYVSIIQRDGKEHLIPNELLITEKVENWSFSNNDIRLSIQIGVSYNTDIHKALELCLEASVEESRIKQFPKPVVRVTGFGESSVDLEIRGWINDPVNGVGNVKSDVLLKVWDKFHEHDIEIPYPQRDLHLKSVPAEMIEKLKNDIVKELKIKQ